MQKWAEICLCHQNVLVLAEAGCLDPRIFCTSCMVRFKRNLHFLQHCYVNTDSCKQYLYELLCSQTKKPVRTNHCFSCDACVAKQDHHSVWTNGCIGTTDRAGKTWNFCLVRQQMALKICHLINSWKCFIIKIHIVVRLGQGLCFIGYFYLKIQCVACGGYIGRNGKLYS